jgi:hypothetical protein
LRGFLAKTPRFRQDRQENKGFGKGLVGGFGLVRVE